MRSTKAPENKRSNRQAPGRARSLDPSPAAFRWAIVPPALLALLVAFALRAYRLDGQSLWYDEGVSVVMAQRDLLSIAVNAAADIHPPLYYYLLHFWVSVAGATEFALRWLSLAFGVLLVALAFKLGQKLFDSHVGLAAAFLAAVAPFPIYYSQEARMYMQVAFFGALSTYLLLRVQSVFETSGGHRLRIGSAIAYVFASAALLYSHYFSFTILVFHNVWMVVHLAGLRDPFSRRLARLGVWVGLQLVIVAAFSPWLAISFAQIGGWPGISEPLSLDTLLYKVFLVFTFGLSWDAAATPRREQFFLLLLACSLLVFLPGRRTKGRAWCFTALYFLVPILLMYVLSLRRPMYNPKFLLLAAPPYYMLLAAGLVSSGRIVAQALLWLRQPPVWLRYTAGTLLAVALLFGVFYGMGKSAVAYYSDPKYARDDYRGLAQFIQSQSETKDAIILNAPGQGEIFGYYYKPKDGQTIFPLPAERPIDARSTESALKRIIDGHKRVWLVLWAQTESDPDGFIERWLDENSFKVSNSWYGGIRLVQYVLGGDAAAWHAETNLGFGENIRLKEVRIGSTFARPADVVNVILSWQALKPLQERYTVFLHVIDDREYLWGQRDSEPGGGNKPTASWTTGGIVEDRHGVPVLPGTPPGSYQIEVGLYQPENGRRLPVFGENGQKVGDRVLLGQLEIVKPASLPKIEALAIQNRVSVTFADKLRLLGFDFHKLGEPASNAELGSGDLVQATLYWQTLGEIGRGFLVNLEIADRDGKPLVRRLVQPAEGRYPTSRWGASEVVRDQHRLALGGVEPGEYSLRLGLIDDETKVSAPVKRDGVALQGMAELARFRVR